MLATLLVVAVAVFASGTVLVNAHRHDTTHSDAIVVLGAAQYAGRPTDLLANRLNHARELYRSRIAPRIITVGGKPIRASRRSLEWCLKSVDQCWSQKERFMKGEELIQAKEAYEHARAVRERNASDRRLSLSVPSALPPK